MATGKSGVHIDNELMNVTARETTNMATLTTEDAKRQLVERLRAGYGITVKDEEWGDDGMGSVVARLGRWRVIEEDEDRGLYDGDEGELTAQMVGSPEHHNLRMAVSFTPEGQDEFSGPEVQPFLDVEPID